MGGRASTPADGESLQPALLPLLDQVKMLTTQMERRAMAIWLKAFERRKMKLSRELGSDRDRRFQRAIDRTAVGEERWTRLAVSRITKGTHGDPRFCRAT